MVQTGILKTKLQEKIQVRLTLHYTMRVPSIGTNRHGGRCDAGSFCMFKHLAQYASKVVKACPSLSYISHGSYNKSPL